MEILTHDAEAKWMVALTEILEPWRARSRDVMSPLAKRMKDRARVTAAREPDAYCRLDGSADRAAGEVLPTS